MDQDEEILYEEEALHEEEIDPSVGGMDDSEDFYVDESTAGKEVYADSDIEGEMGQGGGAMIDEDIQDDATGVFGDHSDSVYCIATSSDTNSVITGGGDDKAFIWNWRDGSKKAELTGFKESVNSVGFSFDGKYAAAADLAGEVRLWEAATGKEYTLEGPGETIEWLTWHSKGTILMAGSADGCTYMWAAATQALMGIFAGHSGSVTCGMFTPDGKKVVTGAEDGSARIWNPKDQQCVATFSGHLWHSLPLTCLEVKSDSQLFITGSEDSYACVGNIATNKPVAKLTGHAASVECVGFSINQNNFVYSGSMDGTLKVWDLNTSQCRATCVHDEATEDHGVTRLVALANQVVTSSTDGVVRLWDERTGLVVKKFTGHRDVILDMVTTQDKSAIITTSDDNTSRVFIL